MIHATNLSRLCGDRTRLNPLAGPFPFLGHAYVRHGALIVDTNFESPLVISLISNRDDIIIHPDSLPCLTLTLIVVK